ncbi:MAG: glycosyltransferase family 1 protein [Pseudomonadota bacterium]
MNYDGPAFGLVRTRFGVVILDRDGLPEMIGDDPLRGARRRAIARVPRVLLPLALERRLPEGFAYFNVGHSHLTRWNMRALPSEARAVLMLHDTIPLDYPDWQRPGQAEVFAKRFKVATQRADTILAPSQASADRIRVHGQADLPVVVAPLGIGAPRASIPPPPGDYFVAIGTLEPRKNFEFLIDIWEHLGEGAPALHIFGSLGWSFGPLLARFENSEFKDKTIFLHLSEPDEVVQGWLAGAKGLLFPSHAEGFGLPPFEAAQLGVPVIAARLPSLEEHLGDWVIYAPTDNLYQWTHEIQNLAANRRSEQPVPPLPTWEAHFNTVLKLL